MILGRLLSSQPQIDGEHYNLQFSYHRDEWYEDAFGQDPQPFIRNPSYGIRQGPPYPWRPAQSTWPTYDVLFGNPTHPTLPQPNSNSFNMFLDSSPGASSISIYGWIPSNLAPQGNMPRVPSQASTVASTGGFLLPGTYLVAIGTSASGPVGQFFTQAVVPPGTNTNVITITGFSFDAAVTIMVYIGTNITNMRLCGISDVFTSGTPDAFGNDTIITITKFGAGRYGLPDTTLNSYTINTKFIIHGGVWGARVTSSSGSSVTIAGATWGTDIWAGYVLSRYKNAGPGQQSPLNLSVVSNTADTLILSYGTGTPIVAGDVVVMRAAASHVSANTIGDDNFINWMYPSGASDNEAGYQIRIIAGTGAGQQPKSILSNTPTIFTINNNWDIAPDATSIWIVEEANWRDTLVGSLLSIRSPASSAIGTVNLTKYSNQSVLVSVLSVDSKGGSWPDWYSPIREVFIDASSPFPGYYTLVPFLSGIAQIDFANGLVQRLVLANTTLNGGISSGDTSLVVNTIVLDSTAATPFNFLWGDGTGEGGVCTAISGTSWTILATANNHLSGAVIYTPVTLPAPVFTGGSIAASLTFTLFVDQDAAGNCLIPIFAGGVGGFATDVGSWQIDGTASTRTTYVFLYSGSAFGLSVLPPATGGPIT